MMIVSRTSFCFSDVEPAADDVDIGAVLLEVPTLRRRCDVDSNGSWHDATIGGASSRGLTRRGAGPARALDSSVRRSIVVISANGGGHNPGILQGFGRGGGSQLLENQLSLHTPMHSRTRV